MFGEPLLAHPTDCSVRLTAHPCDDDDACEQHDDPDDEQHSVLGGAPTAQRRPPMPMRWSWHNGVSKYVRSRANDTAGPIARRVYGAARTFSGRTAATW
jgi:hypothetical protein